MDSIAVQMVEILRAKQADCALRDHTGKPIHLFVNIKDVVLNPRAIDSGKLHPLAVSGSLPGDDSERINWLKAIAITEDRPMPGASLLYSFQVTIHLGDRSARRTGKHVEGSAQRVIDGALGTILMVPVSEGCSVSGQDETPTQMALKWRNGRSSLVVQYDPNLLDHKRV